MFGAGIIVLVLIVVAIYAYNLLKDRRIRKEHALTMVKALAKGRDNDSLEGREIFVLYCLGYFLKLNSIPFKSLTKSHVLKTVRNYLENECNVINEYRIEDYIHSIPVGYYANKEKFIEDIKELEPSIKSLILEEENNLSNLNIYKAIFDQYYLITGQYIPYNNENIRTCAELKQMLEISSKEFDKPYF